MPRPIGVLVPTSSPIGRRNFSCQVLVLKATISSVAELTAYRMSRCGSNARPPSSPGSVCTAPKLAETTDTVLSTSNAIKLLLRLTADSELSSSIAELKLDGNVLLALANVKIGPLEIFDS